MVTKRNSLRTPVYLFLINGITLCFGFIFFIFISLNTLEKTAVIQTEQNLRTFAFSIEQLLYSENNLVLTPDPSFPEGKTVDEFVKQIASHDPSFRISVIGSDGTVLGDSDAEPERLENHATRSEIAGALNGQESTAIRASSFSGELLIYYAIPIIYQNQQLVLRLSIPVRKNVFFSSSLRMDSVLSAVIILLIVLVISFIVAGKILKPLKELEKTARQYQNGNFEYNAEIRSPYEFVELSETFSRMGKTIQNNIQEISCRRDEFQSVFSGITEALIVFDSNLQIQQMNNTAGYFFSIEDIETVHNNSLIAVVRNTEIISFVKDIISCQNIEKNELETQIFVSDADSEKHGPSPRSVLVRCVKIHNSAQGTDRFLLVITDISHLKRLERVRKDFVANVSHELKTPITSIKGFIETLQDGALEEPETARHFLDIMEQQSERLIHILEDLLTLSRLEQTGFALETQPAVLQSLVSDTFAALSRPAEAKHIQLTARFQPEQEPIKISVNTGLFSQALFNLVDNAIKYCPDNSLVTVSAQETETQIFLRIEDDGPGIAEVYRKRIFERFYRIDKGRSRETGGTGLGLSIVRHIIELHGGNIRATARPDGKPGACFEITIPLQTTKLLPEQQKQQDTAQAGKRETAEPDSL